MKIQFRKLGAILCAAVMLLVSVPPVPVQAESVGSLEKTLDLVLVKLGVVCNETGLNDIANTLYDTAIGDVQDFEEYCTSNSLDTSDSSAYDSWKETREYQDHLLDMVMENKYRIATENGEDVTLDFTKDDMNDAIHGGDGVRRGEEYTIDADTVDQVHNVFQDWWSENSGYYIYRVPAFSEIPVSYFSNSNTYNVAKQLVTLTSDYDFIYIAPNSEKLYAQTPAYGAMYYSANTSYNPSDSAFSICQAISWTQTVFQGWRDIGNSSRLYIDCDYLTANYETLTLDNISVITDSYWAPKYTSVTVCNHSGSNHNFIVSNVAKNIKIFKSLEGGKNYDVGQQIVYFTPSYTTVTVNSVSYTGDYYCDNSSVYSYSVVQDNVNNIQGDLTYSIVDSTVDQSVTNIINNYYYTSSSGDGSGDGSGDDDGEGGIFERLIDALGDALGKILGLFEELLDLFLSAIVDAIGIIAQGLTGAVEKLRGLSVQVEGLTGFLKEFFSFVPVDYWDMVSSLMLISFVVLVVKLFKK